MINRLLRAFPRVPGPISPPPSVILIRNDPCFRSLSGLLTEKNRVFRHRNSRQTHANNAARSYSPTLWIVILQRKNGERCTCIGRKQTYRYLNTYKFLEGMRIPYPRRGGTWKERHGESYQLSDISARRDLQLSPSSLSRAAEVRRVVSRLKRRSPERRRAQGTGAE